MLRTPISLGAKKQLKILSPGLCVCSIFVFVYLFACLVLGIARSRYLVRIDLESQKQSDHPFSSVVPLLDY